MAPRPLRPVRGVALALSCAIACATPSRPRDRADDWTAAVIAPGPPLVVTFIDVGQGDAALLQVGDLDVLVDAGTPESCGRILNALASVKGALDWLVITHPHDDHFACAVDVLEAHDVAAVVTNGEGRGPPRDAANRPSWGALLAAVEAEGVPITTWAAGSSHDFGRGLGAAVLASGGRYPDTARGEDINNDSVVFVAEYAERRVFFSGDIEVAASGALVDEHCADVDDCAALESDVLKVPHHGSADVDVRFWRAAQPRWAVISAAHASKKHYLPRQQTVDALRGVGAKVVSTSAAGIEDVTLTIAASGQMSWSLPRGGVFVWTAHRGEGVTSPQGE